MLTLFIKGDELFDEVSQTFIETTAATIRLEHSLISLSKWESIFEKPFLSTNNKTNDEIISYIKFMILDDLVDESIVYRLDQENLNEVNRYINSSQSATTFGTMPEKRGRGEVITSELIYYWMVAFTIPFECQTWHINRLFALIRICNIKNSKQKKLSSHEIASRNRELNEKRKEQLQTSG